MDDYTAAVIIENKNWELTELIKSGYYRLVGEDDVSYKAFAEYVLSIYRQGLYDGAETPWL